MKFTAASIILAAGSAAAFSPFAKKAATPAATVAPFIETMVGALDPVGFFDPLGFAEKADENTLKRYREAELTHGRVASKYSIVENHHLWKNYFTNELSHDDHFLVTNSSKQQCSPPSDSLPVKPSKEAPSFSMPRFLDLPSPTFPRSLFLSGCF